MNMKTLVPLNSIEHLNMLFQSGADELYLGFYDEGWSHYFDNFSDINRMSGFGKYANKYNLSETVEICKTIKESGRNVFLTMNANCYSQSQINYIECNFFPIFENTYIDGLIISDQNIAKAAIAAGFNVVSSTMCAIYNSDIAEFYYNLGIRRMILPRDLSLSEIETICHRFPDVEFEVFFMRNGCIFSDCYCLGMHRPECGSTCGFIRNQPKKTFIKSNKFIDKHNVCTNDFLYNKYFHHDACGMCSLYRMKKIGIKSLKIVGRADMVESVCKDLQITKANIDIAQKCSTEQEYLEKMIFPAGFPNKCMFGLSCYYPEVRFI